MIKAPITTEGPLNRFHKETENCKLISSAQDHAVGQPKTHGAQSPSSLRSGRRPSSRYAANGFRDGAHPKAAHFAARMRNIILLPWIWIALAGLALLTVLVYAFMTAINWIESSIESAGN